MLGRLHYLCVSLALTCSPAVAQSVELSTRTFWIGAPAHEMGSGKRFISLRRFEWLDDVFESDPVLQQTVVHIEESYVPVAAFIAGMHEGSVLLGPDRLPENYVLEDYRVYGPEVATARRFTYVPREPSDGFAVHCGQTDDRTRMSLCVILATYAPDDRLRLMARLYFPPDPVDRPNYFRNVVQRMREIAHCLDITERPETTTEQIQESCDALGTS